MLKPKLFMPAIILTVICLVTTGLVALTFDITRAERERQEIIAANANRLALYPDALSFTPLVEDDTLLPAGLKEALIATGSDGSPIGYIFVSEKRGYGGLVPVMLAVNPDATISGVRVLSNEETPGLGKKVENDTFLGQFFDKPASETFGLRVDNAGGQAIDAVSGATISSRAVTDAINIALLYFQDLEKEVN